MRMSSLPMPVYVAHLMEPVVQPAAQTAIFTGALGDVLTSRVHVRRGVVQRLGDDEVGADGQARPVGLLVGLLVGGADGGDQVAHDARCEELRAVERCHPIGKHVAAVAPNGRQRQTAHVVLAGHSAVLGVGGEQVQPRRVVAAVEQDGIVVVELDHLVAVEPAPTFSAVAHSSITCR